MRYGFIGRALVTAALSTFGIGLALPAHAQKNVGYYGLCDGQGYAEQATAITTAGHTPVNLPNLTAADLAGIDVVFITNCDNSGYSEGEYLANLPAITEAVNAGLVLVFHDRSVTHAAANIPGAGSITFSRVTSPTSKCNYVDVVDDTTFVTDGPGGVIEDGFLDFGTCSFHGTATQGTLPSGATAILNRATHSINDLRRSTTDQVVTFSYPLGRGHVVYSPIPLDYFLKGGGRATVTSFRMRTVYAPNVIAYAASLAAGMMVSGIDHFLLYGVRVEDREEDDAKRIISLSDNFEAVDWRPWFEVGEVKRLGNPVEMGFEVDVSTITDPETHLVAYGIDRLRGEPKHQKLTGVVVTNQFGEITLDTKKPKLMLVPSLTDLVAPIYSEAVADPFAVDHFKCYKVEVTKGMPNFERFQVSVFDQFDQPTLLDVKKPKWLCHSVSKDAAEIVNPDGHLLCYKVKRAKGEEKFKKVNGIHTNNPFGPLKLKAKRERELCVPSEMDLANAVPIPRVDGDDNKKGNKMNGHKNSHKKDDD